MSEQNDDSVGGEHKRTKVRLQEAWQSTLGKFATAEEGSRDLIHRLVEWGKLTGEEGRTLLTDWRRSIEHNRRELERRVEKTVHRSVARFALPSQQDLQDLIQQVDDLEKRVSNLKNSHESEA